MFSNKKIDKKISIKIYELHHRRKFYLHHFSRDRKMVQNTIRNVDEATSGRESHDVVIVTWDNKKKCYLSNR